MKCAPKKCVHLRRSYTCRECGGAGICQHNVVRSSCKLCGGGGICEHGKRRCRCKQCHVLPKHQRQQQCTQLSHRSDADAVVALEKCLFKEVTTHECRLKSTNVEALKRSVSKADLQDLTSAGRALRQCIFTDHNCSESKTQLQLRASASLMQELSIVTQKDIERGACIGILGGERVSTKHKGCVGIQQNNSHYLATIPKTERFPNHAFSMKHQGSILRYANHGCYEAANSRLTANGISVQVWSTKTIKAGSEASVHFS